MRFSNPLTDAETFKIKDGKLVEIEKNKTFDDINGQYMGIIKITFTGWKISNL